MISNNKATFFVNKLETTLSGYLLCVFVGTSVQNFAKLYLILDVK